MKATGIIRFGVIFVGLAAILVGCKDQPALEYPIGIGTLNSTFTQLIPAGQRLPFTFSDIFANAEDNQNAVEVALSQKHADGVEFISTIVADKLPPRPKGTLRVIVTLSINASKELRAKVTITETGYVKEFGPFPVK